MQILPSRPLKEIVPRKGATDGYRGRDEEGQGERRSRDWEEEGEDSEVEGYGEGGIETGRRKERTGKRRR